MPNQARHRYPMECLGEGRVRIGGSFAPNGSSALAAAGMYGTTGWTAAYTSTGLYTVTLDDVWLYLLDWSLGFAMVTATDVVPQLGLVDLPAKTIQIRSLAVATVTDIAADAANRISFGFVFKRSGNSGKR